MLPAASLRSQKAELMGVPATHLASLMLFSAVNVTAATTTAD